MNGKCVCRTAPATPGLLTQLHNVANYVNQVCVRFVRDWMPFKIKHTVFLYKLNLPSQFCIFLGISSLKFKLLVFICIFIELCVLLMGLLGIFFVIYLFCHLLCFVGNLVWSNNMYFLG